MMRWEISHHIRSVLLNNDRAEYGKRIVTKLLSQLAELYGDAFDIHNLRRMIRFAERFGNINVVTKPSPKTVFEQKIKEIVHEARERLKRRGSLSINGKKQIDYFLEKKDEDD